MTATDLTEETGHRVVGPERMRWTGWRWRYVRCAAFAAYAVGLLVFVELVGVPTDRLGIYAGILVFLTIAVLGRGWAAWWQMMVDWLPFQAVLLAYDYSRGYASPYSDAQVHAQDLPDHRRPQRPRPAAARARSRSPSTSGSAACSAGAA